MIMTNVEKVKKGKIMDKKYITKITLLDDTEIIEYRDYDWGFESELKDPYNKFLNINNTYIAKSQIKTIITIKNEDYVESEKEEE